MVDQAQILTKVIKCQQRRNGHNCTKPAKQTCVVHNIKLCTVDMVLHTQWHATRHVYDSRNPLCDVSNA